MGSDMRPLFAILVLLLCVIATRADDPLVIKDSEAVHYVGKNVEVRGLVVSLRPALGITGKIELHQGKPEIKVTSTDQIKGLDSQRAQ